MFFTRKDAKPLRMTRVQIITLTYALITAIKRAPPNTLASFEPKISIVMAIIATIPACSSIAFVVAEKPSETAREADLPVRKEDLMLSNKVIFIVKATRSVAIIATITAVESFNPKAEMSIAERERALIVETMPAKPQRR